MVSNSPGGIYGVRNDTHSASGFHDSFAHFITFGVYMACTGFQVVNVCFFCAFQNLLIPLQVPLAAVANEVYEFSSSLLSDDDFMNLGACIVLGIWAFFCSFRSKIRHQARARVLDFHMLALVRLLEVEPAAIEPALRFRVIFVLLSTPDMYFYGLEWMWLCFTFLYPRCATTLGKAAGRRGWGALSLHINPTKS